MAENNAKFAVALRRILPSPNNFKRDHYIALQMNGELDGSISMSAPSVLQMRCGEKPVQEVAGLWYAENGDIRLVAPEGKIVLEAASIALIANGGERSGNIYLDATQEVKLTGDKMTSVFDESIGFEVEKDFNVNCSGRAEVFCGDFSVVEASDVALTVLLRGGQGTMGVEKFFKGVAKLIRSIA